MKEFTKNAQKALTIADKISSQYGHPYTGTEHLLYGLSAEQSGLAAVLLHTQKAESEKILDLIEDLIAPESSTAAAGEDGKSPRLEEIISAAQDLAERYGSSRVGTEHLLMAIVLRNDCAAHRLLATMGVNMQDMYTQFLILMGENPSDHKEDLKGANGESTSSTPNLDQYSRDMTKLAKEGRMDPIIGRQREIDRVIQILCRKTKNNPCLIGEPGVGKTAITEGLAQRIARGDVPGPIQGKRLVSLDLSAMVAGSKYRGEFEERIKNVVSEVADSGNILLFIDEIHTMVGAGSAEGSLDASNILKPSLSRGEIQLIGATTIAEYRKYIEKDAALERRFQPIMVDEPTSAQTEEILKGLRPGYEKHHQVVITDEAVHAAVQLSERYINDRFLPDKALDVMDEASALVRLKGYAISESADKEKQIRILTGQMEEALERGSLEEASALKKNIDELEKQVEERRKRDERRRKHKKTVVTEKEISQVISQWTGIPASQISEAESKRLLNLEKILHQRVIGQEEAVTAVARAVKRGRVGLKDPNRPIGSFLFLGPTGVGKTELSKALAQAMFGSESAMIRVDMSEYMEKHSVSKMIGSPPGYIGYEESGQLSEKVRRNPYSVVLFDEIEKAHPDVFNILLQVLDDGHITDSQGRKVDFKNTIIIMTSNAGAKHIIDPKKLGFGAQQEDEAADYDRMKSGVMEEVQRIFKPEFLNRIDEILVFHTLSKDDMKKIVTLQLKDLEKRCSEQMHIELHVTASVKKALVDNSYDVKYGARPLKRMIQTKIEDPLAQEILSGHVRPGERVSVRMQKKEIVFVPVTE